MKSELKPTPHTYVINLSDAKERMDYMRAELERLDLPYKRIDAILGRELPEPIIQFSEKSFNILTGKHKNYGEIGCYLSHLKAFEEFLESESEHALILEDDVNLPDDLPRLIQGAITHHKHWDLLRLSSSREGQYLKIADIDPDYSLTYNTKVLKNTGAYVINRKAAKACVDKMLPMRLPYDVALDRDWDFGFKTACITPFPIACEDFPSQINKAKRKRLYRSTTFHLFHLLTRIQRKYYRTQYHKELPQDSIR